MLIVRGVNLFPSAIRSILREFSPEVGETFRIFPRNKGVRQTPPLPVVVELAEGRDQVPDGLDQRVSTEIRSRLLVNTDVSFVPYRTLPRETYKSALVDYSRALGSADN